jgi:quinol-cytochrome oxidoreductase complex cytochrome b subunit
MAASFTGYLLPWDQLAYWAITICTGMLGYVPLFGGWLQDIVRGGVEINSATLVAFYALHTTLIPLLLLTLMGFHFWRVRKAHGVVVPERNNNLPEDNQNYIQAFPHLIQRELSYGLALTALVLMLAVFLDAPLDDPANPGMSPNPAKAPWYFMGLQELQLHFHPLFSVLLFPLMTTVALALVPYLHYKNAPHGKWFLSKSGKRTAIITACLALVLTPTLVLTDDMWLLPSSGLPSVIWRAAIPLSMLFAVSFGLALLFKHFLKTSKAELVQALFTLFFVSFAVLTVLGVWFRGPGMALVWPGAGN